MIEITKDMLLVMQLVNENAVYRITAEKGESSLAYKQNMQTIRQLEENGIIGCYGQCRRDYFLTRLGLELYNKHKGDCI